MKNPKSQTVPIGATATFTITVTNTGDVTLTDVHVVDALSPNCNRTKADIPALASMAPGAAVTYTCTRPNVRCTGSAAPKSCAVFTNVATAIGTPPVGPDVTATDSAPVKVKPSPTAVGQPYTCAFSVQNVLDEANDTLTINSLTDTVHAAGGDVGGATNILPLVRVTTLTPPPNPVQSGATCTAASGDGSLATPYTGVTTCTLPSGSRLQVLPFSHYTVQAADFALPGHVLRDDGSLGWHDLCNGSSPENCNPNPPNGAASQSLVVDANVRSRRRARTTRWAPITCNVQVARTAGTSASVPNPTGA